MPYGMTCEGLDYHGGDFKDICLLWYDTVQFDKNIPTFRRNSLLLSLGYIYKNTRRHTPEYICLHNGH